MHSKPARAALLIALGHLTIELCNNYLPVLYPLFIETLELSYTQIGTIALVASVAVTLPQPLFGYLSDRWHPRRLVALSTVWVGLAMGLVGLVPGYSSLLLLVALGGLGSAAFHPPAAVTASAGSSTRKGAAMSIFSVGGNVGTALSPLLITAGIGWLGLYSTSIVFPIALLMGAFLYHQFDQLAYSGTNQPSSPSSRRNHGSLEGLILVTMAVMARSWFQVTLTTYLPTWVENQGEASAAGGQMLFLLLICVGAGSLTGGVVSDRVSRWKAMALSMALLAPTLWLFLGGFGVFQLVLLGITGFLIGSSFPVAIVMAQEALPQRIGMASGLIMGLGWLPGGLGASFTGLIADRLSLTVALQTLVVPPILGAICSLLYGIRGGFTFLADSPEHPRTL
ncbi:MAG: Fosmidomycin resistance protein [Anaerolineales bacterium]|nr:Fosmidomycin resistance protein [Anaerolineales bacterium]